MTEIQDYGMDDFETLYHYTSTDGLKSIIENKTIRFSDYRFLNDIDELEYGKKVFRQVLDELKNETPEYLKYISQWEGELKNIDEGKILGIIGTSGCGKSTLFNIITKLEKPTSGYIKENKKLKIGYMMQTDALLPWLTVYENAILGLKLKKILTKENIEYVNSLLKKYGLFEFSSEYPNNLSGGMRQRVALIRTLAIKPNILLLDEPFSKLDIDSRIK